MRIALYGLGIIGSIWSKNLATDGHAVKAWNRSPKPEHPCYTADAVAAACDAELVMIVVADGPAVNQVLDMIMPHLTKGTIVANHATIGVDEVTTIATRVRAAGCEFLDMPFTGSKPAAEARQTVFFVGDDAGIFSRVEPVLKPLTKAIAQLGPVGSAMTIKLAMNLMIATSYQGLAEGFRLATAAGIAPDTFFACLDINIARSGVTDLKKPKLLARDWSAQFSVKHMHKDLRHALALAAARKLTLPQTRELERAYAAITAKGLGDADFSALYEHLS